MTILVATYRAANAVWIKERNLYNLPLPKCGKTAFHERVERVVLIAEGAKPMAFEARFREVVDSAWLKANGYALAPAEKRHGESYALYELREKVPFAAALADSAAEVFVASQRCPRVKIDAEFYNRPYPKTGGRSMPHIFDTLKPYFKKWRSAVVFNPVQTDFFDELVGSDAGSDAKTDVPFPPPKNPKFTFIDLFAGIGGFRIAMQNCGGKCVFSSEWDKAAQQTYAANYGETPFGDITKDETKAAIPENFDVLCAGFPCQPFSLAGVSARTAANKQHGFADKTQGTLFFDVLQIVRERMPQVVFLENVRNLVNHDHGRTFSVIRESLEGLGYSFNYKVIDASSVVPQKRVRCYMVCVRGNGRYSFPEISGDEKPLSEILEKKVADSYTISDGLWAGHKRRTRANLARGAGFTAFTADVSKPSHTLVARYYKDGKECLIPQEGKNPRMLTPRECARLQGYPEKFVLPSARSAAYKQMGNSVVVPVLNRIAENIVHQILER